MRSIVPEQITSYGSNKKGACYSPLLFVVILSSGLLKLRHLGHPSLHSPDECCHALVAKNLLKHPLTPTLIDIPYLSTLAFDWGANHVWLHKPILGLWQITGSYWLFGVSTWALRFPSVILSTLAVHPLSNSDEWEEKASQVRKAGGIPYLVSSREWPLPVVFTSLTDKRIIYSHEVP